MPHISEIIWYLSERSCYDRIFLKRHCALANIILMGKKKRLPDSSVYRQADFLQFS